MDPSPISTACPFRDLLARALDARAGLLATDPEHQGAFRLFNGFSEGCPDLAVDVYGTTLLLHDYADPEHPAGELAATAQSFFAERLPWLRAVALKNRRPSGPGSDAGTLVLGTEPTGEIEEGGVRYAVDLLLNRDASFYLDTRALRAWARSHLSGKTVLNTFAYTGSLGVAARAGGATRVVQLDRNPRFLALGRRSWELNGFPPGDPADWIAGDFFPTIARLKRRGARFDCIFLDPPVFASTRYGVVDQLRDCARLINKVRPLIADGGFLVAVNNALFLPGRDYIAALEALCADGYLAVQELIPVPQDITGFPATRVGVPVTDPAPFNHATKIAVLSVRRKAPGAGLVG